MKEMKEKTHVKQKKHHAFWFLMVVLAIIYIADEISSNMTGVMKPYMIFDLFKVPNSDASSSEYASAISVMAIATIPTYIITAVNPLYRTLADKFGRKIFLVINTIMMGVGMLICAVAPNVYVFIIGNCVLGFFTPNDMQVIYLMETAPKEHRAKLCSITKGVGLLSVSLIGVFRAIFYDPSDLTTWRLVYIIPVTIALVIGTLTIFVTSETPVFLEKRKAMQAAKAAAAIRSDVTPSANAAGTSENPAQISNVMPDTVVDTAVADAETGDTSDQPVEKVSIGAAFKYIFKTKQTRMIMIVLMIFSIAVGMSGYVAEVLLSSKHLTSDDINLFYIIEPIVYAICAFFSGFLTDKAGRKNAGMIFGIAAIIGQCCFVFGAKLGLGPVGLAIANGCMYGGLWSFSDLMFLTLPAESAPTHIRATVMSVLSYASITNMLASMLVGIFFTKIGSANIGTFQLCFFVPIMIISVLFLKLNVKETKDVDMAHVK